MPEISVIIPTYNRRKTIVQAVRSVLNQSFYDLECIVVDDGSDDGTCEAIKKIKDDRLKYFELSGNFGACHARNFGIGVAVGKYIAFQDSDDIWHKEKLEKQILFLRENNADFVFCSMRQIDNTLRKKDIIFPENLKEGYVSAGKVLEGSCASTQCMLMNKKCLDEIRFDEHLPRYQDWDLILRISKKHTVYFQDFVLVKHPIGYDSISSNSKKGLFACEYLYKKYKKDFDANKKARADIFENIGIFRSKNGINATKCFAKAIVDYPFSYKYWIRFILSLSGVLEKVYGWRER